MLSCPLPAVDNAVTDKHAIGMANKSNEMIYFLQLVLRRGTSTYANGREQRQQQHARQQACTKPFHPDGRLL